jgi:hypothetical protein
MVIDGMRLKVKIHYCRNKIRSEPEISTREHITAGKWITSVVQIAACG